MLIINTLSYHYQLLMTGLVKLLMLMLVLLKI